MEFNNDMWVYILQLTSKGHCSSIPHFYNHKTIRQLF